MGMGGMRGMGRGSGGRDGGGGGGEGGGGGGGMGREHGRGMGTRRRMVRLVGGHVWRLVSVMGRVVVGGRRRGL